MAIRQEELLASEAIVYPFPTGMIAARRARRAMMARRRRTLAVATVGLATVLLMTAGPQGSAQASRAASTRVVTVQPGTTLWTWQIDSRTTPWIPGPTSKPSLP